MAVFLITGGTGLIGSALTRHLTMLGHTCIILTRDPSKARAQQHVRYAAWNIQAGTIDEGAIADADYIIHLAGANVADKRWSAARKKEIVDSRVESGKLIVKALSELPHKVQAVISASAIGWYGPDPQIPNPAPFIEADAPAKDFLGTTSVAWEQSLKPLNDLGIRTVFLRTGIVLDREGGAFAEFYKPLKFGIAPILGNGRQVISWIHVKDLVRMYEQAALDINWQGAYNAVSPHPVSNKELIAVMAEKKRGFSVPAPIPSFVLKLMLGEMSIEILKSATVSAAKVLQQGFTFDFPNVERAVEELME